MAIRWITDGTEVALRMEGEDRNEYNWEVAKVVNVALRMEGEDRNLLSAPRQCTRSRRPPYGGRG